MSLDLPAREPVDRTPRSRKVVGRAVAGAADERAAQAPGPCGEVNTTPRAEEMPVTVDSFPGSPRWGRGGSSRSSGYRSRTYYLPDDLHFRLRNAWWHTQTERDGHDSISALVTWALLPVVTELEARYNQGRPFPEIPDGRRPRAGPRKGRRALHSPSARFGITPSGRTPT